MSEEKKEEKIEAQKAVQPAGVPPAAPKKEGGEPPKETPEAVKQKTPQAPAPQPAAETPKEVKKAPVAAKTEKPSNCAGCNKSIKKKRWYYRNGKFYCSQRCWKSAVKKAASAPAPA